MCGIIGIKSSRANDYSDSIFDLMKTFDYRGPDDSGVWTSDEIILGHRRLSIIDPTPDGHQPMINADNGNVIVFNGEIYNYIEIKNDLQKAGLTFNTNTDTEVILKAYDKYGTDCLSHFNGMFSFCIYDRSSGILFLARDRLGVKPLYYYHSKNEFIFSSEIKAIKKHRNDLTNNTCLIDSYMSYGYVPGENTLLSGVKRILPGHCAILDTNNILSIKQYWNIPHQSVIDYGEEYYLEKINDLLVDSLSLRLRSDVPLGVFLSGGLDSSAVVALLSEKIQSRLKTFSVSFDFGEKYDESKYADLVSKRFNTEHHKIVISPDDFMKFIPKYISYMDEPVTEAAAISLNYVSKLASKHVKVVLSGEGSDEIFAGYDLYKYMLVIEKIRTLFGNKNTNYIYKLFSSLLNENRKLLKYLKLASIPLEKRYNGISSYEDRYKDILYSKEFKNSLITDRQTDIDKFINSIFEETSKLDTLSKMLNFDLKTWLVDDLLIKADRMSMASSIELRVPFLDYRLVETAYNMPSKYKIKFGQSKYILKRLMKNRLPNEIIHRKKMGFPTPLKLMFESHLKDYAFDTLLKNNASIHNYFEPSAIEKLLVEHTNKVHDHHRTIWQLIVLEEWLKAN